MKKRIVLCFIASMFVGMLSACGSTNTTDTATEETRSQDVDGVSDEEFTLRISSTEPGEDRLDRAAEIFQEKYPNATIEFEVAPWGPGGSELRDKQLVSIAAGADLDIGKMIWAKEFYARGVLEDMTEIVQSWPLYEQYTEGQKERIMYDGKIVAPTRGNETVYMYYNKDIFEQAGITEPPQTLDEMVEVAKKIKEADLKTTSGNPVYTVNFEGGNWVTDYWLWAGGGEQMNDDYSKTLIDTPESIAAYKFMQEFVTNEWSPKPDGTYDQQWLNGQVAIWFCGDWNIEATVDAGINAGFAEMPYGPTDKNTVSIGGIEWGIFKSSQNKEKAIEFLEILFSDELAKETGLQFSNLDLWRDPEVQETWKEESQARFDSKMVQAEQLENSRYNFLEAPYVFPESSQIYNEALEKILVRGDDPETTMQEAARIINEGIAEANK